MADLVNGFKHRSVLLYRFNGGLATVLFRSKISVSMICHTFHINWQGFHTHIKTVAQVRLHL